MCCAFVAQRTALQVTDAPCCLLGLSNHARPRSNSTRRVAHSAPCAPARAHTSRAAPAARGGMVVAKPLLHLTVIASARHMGARPATLKRERLACGCGCRSFEVQGMQVLLMRHGGRRGGQARVRCRAVRAADVRMLGT